MQNRNGSAPNVRSVVTSFSRKEQQDYSLVNLIVRSADIAEGRGPGMTGDPSIEGEVSGVISRALGTIPREHGGFFVPLVEAEERSGLATSSNAAGGYAVQGTIGELIPLLRARTLALKLGAQLLPSIVGNALLPVQSVGSTGSWVGEAGADQSESDAAFAQKSLSPHLYCVTTSYSRRFLNLSSVAAEEFVRADLMAHLGRALDAAILNGSGAANQPTGILQSSGVDTTVVGGTNGAQLSLANILQMQSNVAVANADDGLAIVTTPAVRNRAKQTLKVAGATSCLWDDDDKMSGIPSYVTTSLPINLSKGSASNCSPLILGNFGTITLGLWNGTAEIVVDPFRLKKQGMLEVTLYTEADVCLRLPQAFSTMKDLLP